MNTQFLQLDMHDLCGSTAGWPIEKIGLLMRVVNLAWAWQRFPLHPDVLSKESRRYLGVDPRVMRRLYDPELEALAKRLLSRRARLEKVDRYAVYKRSGGACEYCGDQIDINNFHVDHRVPVLACGLSDAENLAAACAPCNLAKGATHHG